MNISPELLDQLIKFLTPALPVLMKGGAELGQAVWQKGKDKFADWVMEKLLPQAKQDPDIKEALEDAAEKAEERRARYLKTALEEFFEKYPALRQEAERVMIQIHAEGGSVVVNGNMIGGSISVHNETVFASIKESVARSAYLNNLKNYCNSLPTAILGEEKDSDVKISLDKVYIDLDTTTFIEDLEGQEKRGEKGDEKKTPLKVMQATARTKRMILRGEAGSGKSVFVKNLLGLQASVLLGNGKPLPEISPDLLPVYIELRNLTPKLKAANLDSLPLLDKKAKFSNLILEAIGEDARARNAEDFIPEIKAAFNSGKILLVLDGLDETPQAARKMVQEAVRAVIDFQNIERIIITSRPNVVIEPKDFPNFKEYAIKPLNKKQIEFFARAWYEELRDLTLFTKEQAEERIKDLARSATEDQLLELSCNPMTLTILALIHRKGAKLPKKRAELYKKVVEIFSDTWQKQKANSVELAPELEKFLEDERRLSKALRHLAYAAHESNAKNEGDLSRAKALDILERYHFNKDDVLALQFLKYIEQRSGLLEDTSGRQNNAGVFYRFPHRSIQEYLAGCYMVNQDNSTEIYWQCAAAGVDWVKPALMGAEHIIHNEPSAWKNLMFMMDELCKENPLESGQAERATLWAGQIAVEYGIDEIASQWGRGKDFLNRLQLNTLRLIESGKYLTPVERAEAGNTLAKLGDLREGVTKDFLFCRIPPGEFMMGSKEGEGDSDEHPQFKRKIKQEFYMTRYPITNAQFKLFVDAGGYATEKYWGEAKAAGYWQSGKGFKGILDDEFRTAPVSYREPFNLPNHPVVGVSWYEAVAYCRWLTEKLRDTSYTLQGTSYKVQVYEPQTRAILEDANLQSLISARQFEIRLPKESEWEYAARAGTDTPYSWGDTITPDHANYDKTGIGATSAVGLFPKGENKFGLLDMSGNVWEWCLTKWQGDYKDYLKNEEKLNDLAGDERRVVRGGSYNNVGSALRCAIRYWDNPDLRLDDPGFRVVVVSSFPISHSSGS